MPEPVTETPETPTPETVEQPAPSETDWKAEARKWETRAKANLEAAEKLAALEEANKSEAQKLLERAEAAEKALTVTQLDAARAQVALEKGLTPTQAKRLVGSTRDEFLADADELLADLGKPTHPAPDPSQGPKPAGGAVDPAQAFAEHLKSQLGQSAH